MSADSVSNFGSMPQNSPAAAGKASAGPRTVATSPLLKAAGFLRGERVFDAATGNDVVVEDATRAPGASDYTVYVRKIDGSRVPRHPFELIRRPTPPASAK